MGVKKNNILHNVCSYGFDDYIYMAAVPFNNNDIFMKQLNSIAIIIGLNKTK